MRCTLLTALLTLCSCGGVIGSGQGGGDSGAIKDGTVADGIGAGDSKMPEDAGAHEAAKAVDALPETAAPEAAGPDVGGTPDARVGSPCKQNSDCPTLCDDDAQCAPLCLDQAPFTGGYCSREIGECPAPSGSDAGSGPCPPGTFCANGQPPVSGTGGDYCLVACKTSGDCRSAEGYKCCLGLTHAGATVCAPVSLCP